MIYGLIEVKPKINKIKIAIISMIIIGIILAIVGVLFFVKLPNENNVLINQDQKNVNKSKHYAKVNMLPVYSEEGKQRLQNIYSSGEKAVYLTFDDGPSKSVTPLILDLLKQENVKATFFLLGSRVELNPNIVKRTYEEGHYIANHGYSHIYGNIYSSKEAVLEEYNKTNQAIQNAIGKPYNCYLFRFPGGSNGGKYRLLKNEAKTLLEENQIGYIDWNALSQDAAGAKTTEALLENVKATVGEKNTVVILMHDSGDKILTYEVLPQVIAYLREKGYAFKNFYNIMK